MIYMMGTVLEKDIQRGVLDYLSLRRVFHWRNNTGAFATESKGRTRFVRYGSVGSPDIFALQDGTLYGIEVKTPKGTQSDHQRLFQYDMERNGAKYHLVRSIDDIKALFP